MNRRTLGPGGPEVSEIGLGCMGMSAFYGATDEDESIATIHRALELGCDFLDTSDMYGPHTNEELVGRAIAGRRDEVFLATKFGIKLELGARRACAALGGRQPRVRARSVRGLAAAPRRRAHRPLLPAPRRPRHPDRGDRRRDGRAGEGGQGPPPRPLRGERRRRSAARTRCTRSPPCRASTRCGRATWRRRSCRRSTSWGSRWSPTRRSAAASSSGASPRARRSKRATSAATAPASASENFERNLVLTERVRELAAEKGVTPAQLALAWVLLARRAHRPDPGHQAALVPGGQPRRRRGAAEPGGVRADRRRGAARDG